MPSLSDISGFYFDRHKLTCRDIFITRECHLTTNRVRSRITCRRDKVNRGKILNFALVSVNCQQSLRVRRPYRFWQPSLLISHRFPDAFDQIATFRLYTVCIVAHAVQRQRPFRFVHQIMKPDVRIAEGNCKPPVRRYQPVVRILCRLFQARLSQAGREISHHQH